MQLLLEHLNNASHNHRHKGTFLIGTEASESQPLTFVSESDIRRLNAASFHSSDTIAGVFPFFDGNRKRSLSSRYSSERFTRSTSRRSNARRSLVLLLVQYLHYYAHPFDPEREPGIVN